MLIRLQTDTADKAKVYPPFSDTVVIVEGYWLLVRWRY